MNEWIIYSFICIRSFNGGASSATYWHSPRLLCWGVNSHFAFYVLAFTRDYQPWSKSLKSKDKSVYIIRGENVKGENVKGEMLCNPVEGSLASCESRWLQYK